MGTYNTISAGPAFLALRVDALLRLGRADEAAAAISAADAFNLSHNRFMAAALAAARFRLEPTLQQASTAETVTAATPWPWLRALVGCWRGEFLQDADAAERARRQFDEIGAELGVRRATVASHVAHILTKLGFSSRAQIAAWAAQRRTLAP